MINATDSIEMFNDEEQENKIITSKCTTKATYVAQFIVFIMIIRQVLQKKRGKL